MKQRGDSGYFLAIFRIPYSDSPILASGEEETAIPAETRAFHSLFGIMTCQSKDLEIALHIPHCGTAVNAGNHHPAAVWAKPSCVDSAILKPDPDQLWTLPQDHTQMNAMPLCSLDVALFQPQRLRKGRQRA